MTARITRRHLAPLVLAAVLALVPVFSAPAQAAEVPHAAVVAAGDVNDFDFDSVTVHYRLSPGTNGAGALDVTETYVADFVQQDTHRGMRISLPDSLNGNPLNPELISITDENGKPRAEETDSGGGSVTFTSRASDFVTGTQTYVFHYTVDNVISHYDKEGVDELYWDVLTPTWAQQFRNVTATLDMSADLAEHLTGNASCYYGPEGASTPCQITRRGDAFEMLPMPLPAKQGITIAVGFDAGTFTQIDSSYFAQPGAAVQVGLGGVGLLGIIAAIFARRGNLKDAPGRGIVVPQYEPPAGVDAMQAAILLQRATAAVPAEILEQAVRGSLQIQERGGKGAIVLVLVDPRRAGDADGRELLGHLFGDDLLPGSVVDLKAETGLAAKVYPMLSGLKKQMLAAGLRRKPRALWRVVVPTILTFAVLAAGGAAVWILATTRSGMGFVGAGGVLLLAVIAGGLLTRLPLTPSGAELVEHLDGLKMFMQWAEADRIRMLQSVQGAERIVGDAANPATLIRIYEPLLPFAVVFGIEKSWSKQLTLYYDSTDVQPQWYVGVSPFSAASLSSVVTATTASTSSSSSSGSSGGGSVGGGGGGTSGGGV